MGFFTYFFLSGCILLLSIFIHASPGPCTTNTLPIDCFYNITCTWNFASNQCVINNEICALRLTRTDCHRDGLCYWTGSTCVNRNVPSQMQIVDTECGALLELDNLVTSGDNCNSQLNCEYDIYTLRCISERLITCPFNYDSNSCETTAGCWWSPDGTCRALARDYLAFCADFDESPDGCNALVGSCVYNLATNLCDPPLKTASYPYYPLMEFCRLDLQQPFLTYCNDTTACGVDCTLKDSRCEVTISPSAMDICQPSASYVCTWVAEQDTCLEYSFCTWANSTCINPLAPPITTPTPQGSLASGDANINATVAVLALIAGVLFISVVIWYLVRHRRQKQQQQQKGLNTEPLLYQQTTVATTTTVSRPMHPRVVHPPPSSTRNNHHQHQIVYAHL